MLETNAHLPRPCNRCALLRHRRDLLVPQMQIDEALAGVARRAVRKHEVLIQTAEFDTQNASRVMGIFDDGLPAAQYAVQPKDELVQPKMPLSPHRRPDPPPLLQSIHGTGCLTARLLPLQSTNLHRLPICTKPHNEQSMTLKLVTLAAPSSLWIGPPAPATARAAGTLGRHRRIEVMECRRSG